LSPATKVVALKEFFGLVWFVGLVRTRIFLKVEDFQVILGCLRIFMEG